MTRAIARDPIYGSGASRDFWPVKTPWRIEGPQAENPKSLISSRFPSLTRVTRGASATERGLLSADAPEPNPSAGTRPLLPRPSENVQGCPPNEQKSGDLRGFLRFLMSNNVRIDT